MSPHLKYFVGLFTHLLRRSNVPNVPLSLSVVTARDTSSDFVMLPKFTQWVESLRWEPRTVELEVGFTIDYKTIE